jgi:Sulfotransferase domain
LLLFKGVDTEPRNKMVVIKRDLNWKKKILQYFSNEGCTIAPLDISPPSWLEQMVILIGVQKGGTKALFSFLQEHPSVVSKCNDDARKTELFFFDNRTLQYDQIDQQELQIQYSKHVQGKCPLAVSALEEDSSKIFLDDSPGYMLESHQVSKLLNCVLPKSKIIALVRDPTARAYSHYNFYVNRNWCTEFTFEEWIDKNIQDLKEAGITDAKDPYEELLAWRKYNDDPIHRKSRNCNSFVTRGLYAIELLHYMTSLIASGRPKSDLHVIISENLRGDTRQDEYDSLLQFLGLESHEILHIGDVHATDYETTMKESTRVKLDQFFGPYNERLYRMMGWNPIWSADPDKNIES